MVTPSPESLRARRLIGREAELRTLTDPLDAAGRPGAARLLLGEGGAGKTRLRTEIVGAANARGALVLSGRSVPGAGQRPYRAVLEATNGSLRSRADRGADPVTERLQRAATRMEPRDGAERGHDPVAVAESLIGALSVATRGGPVLMTVDDVHEADPETRAVLDYLVDNLHAHGAYLLMTARSSSADGWVQRLLDRRGAIAVELPPLDDAAVHRLVLECLDQDAAPRELVAFVQQRAHGNPYAVEELLAGLVRSGALAPANDGWQLVAPRLTTVAPATVAASVAERFQALAPHTQRMLEAAALLGHTFDWTLLGEVTELDEPTVLAGLREASYAGLVVADHDQTGFRHALTRDEVLRRMLPPHRRQVAGRTLDVVLERSPELEGEAAETALTLAELAGDTDHWRRLLLLTGERAAEHGALATATARLRHAAERPDGATADQIAVTALGRLASLQALAGDLESARTAARAVLDAESTDHDERRAAHLTLARAALGAEDLAAARRHLAAADETVPTRPGGPDAAATVVLRAHVELAAGELDRAGELALEVARRAVDPTAPALHCEACEVLGRAARGYDVATAERWFLAALRTAEEHELPIWRARALHELGTIDLLDTMRLDRLRAARRAAIEAGVPSTIVAADFHLAEALVTRDETLAGRLAAERAATLAARIGSPMLPWATLTIARSHAHDRDDAAMEAAVAKALRSGGDDVALRAAVEGRVLAMRAAHGANREALGRHLQHAADLLVQVPGHHFPNWGLWALVTTATEPDRYDAVAARSRAAAGADTRFNKALVIAAAAVAEGFRGDPEAASRYWEDALAEVRTYEGHSWLLQLTRWVARDAAWRDGWGDPIGWAQDAVRWFSEQGHEPLATDSRRFLKTVGAPAPRRGRGESQVPAALRVRGVTSREADVLGLVALRLSNADIAARLVLSPRTVEKHVASLLTKSGCSDRAALAALADALADGDAPASEPLPLR